MISYMLIKTHSLLPSMKYATVTRVIRNAKSNVNMFHKNEDLIRSNPQFQFGTRSYTNLRIRKRKCQGTSDQSSFYITTPIYYVNGDPHVGHAYTSVVSDIIARFASLDGKDTFFLTGTDEHGQKVEQSAKLAGMTPIAFADTISSKFRCLVSELNCSNSDFIRTTEDRHKSAVQQLWNKLMENNQIYLGAYEGWYSIRDEAFYAESELIDGKAPTGAAVEWVKEESYFFKLSEWTDKLLAHYRENPDFVGPKGRINEVINFVAQEGGLRDLSISRTTFEWGIPVPGDPKHVVYVWLDALTNYLSAIGYPDTSESSAFNKYWPASIQIVGKDILRFHAIYWPAFLMAAGIPLPKRIYAHGWWTKDGEKMSKSLGNVIDPFELISKYGVDYVRYYMAAEIAFGNDGDFNEGTFNIRINSDLANDVGNLAQRVLTLIQKHCDSIIPTPGVLTPEDEDMISKSVNTLPLIRDCMQCQNIKQACELIMNISKHGNKYIDTAAPWNLRKTEAGTERMQTVLYVLLETIRGIAVLLQPFVPASSANMLDQIGAPTDWRSFQSLQHRIPSGISIGNPSPIFPKLEIEENVPDFKVTTRGGGGKVAVAAGGSGASKKQSQAVDLKLVESYSKLPSVDLERLILEVGSEIRHLKSNPDVSKDAIKAKVSDLVALKESLKIVSCGI